MTLARPPELTRRRRASVFICDLDVDDPAAAGARRSLRRGRFDDAERLLASSRDTNERAYYAEALGDWPGDPDFLRRWAEQAPSPAAQLVAALQRMKWAWQARGGASASSVKKEAFEEFFKRLPVARAALVACLKSQPRDAAPLPWLMWCARGLGDRALADQAFAEAQRRDPALRAAYSSMLYTVLGRWFGSEEEMFDFARRHAGAAPHAGTPTLIIEAHRFRHEEFTFGSADAKSYWLRPQVRSEVLEADAACRQAGIFGMNGVRTRHWLAYGLWKCGEHPGAAEHFRSLGKTWSQWPWGGFRSGFNWLFNPYGKARKECLRA